MDQIGFDERLAAIEEALLAVLPRSKAMIKAIFHPGKPLK